MLDMFNLPPNFKGDVQIFRCNSSVDQKGLSIWTKPARSSFVYILAIGGGAAGGAGFTRVAGNPGGGGGGGASSCTARVTIPSIFLPDTLYVQVGQGGRGGNGNGGNGLNSYVTVSPASIANPNLVLQANFTVPGGGQAGTAGAAGAAGTIPSTGAPTVFTQSYAVGGTNQVGLVGIIGGAQTGASGGNYASGWLSYFLTPGAGGAGCTTTDFSGGRITSSAAIDFVYFTASGDMIPQATAVGANGNSGLQLTKPFAMCGGGGGASNNVGQAGAGGHGGIGCGGGGGGAGATGGNGGNGGDGIVVIISF